MYFEQFYLTCLAHASYMIGSEGEAAVVDPQRDVDIYLKAAEEQNLKIRHIFETHLHADFVSGHKELAARTGAKIYIGAQANAGFPHVALTDGFEVKMGAVRIRALETPGHTPESVCLVIADEEKSANGRSAQGRSAEPCAVLTGDTLFIGDVGSPDLAKTHTPSQLAGLLYDSRHQKLLTLPDAVMVYPAHGAGSLCGRAMRAERSSKIGTERLTNYALQIANRNEFIAQLTTNLPTRPEYFLEDAEINRSGAATLTELPSLRGLSPAEVQTLKRRQFRQRCRTRAIDLGVLQKIFGTSRQVGGQLRDEFIPVRDLQRIVRKPLCPDRGRALRPHRAPTQRSRPVRGIHHHRIRQRQQLLVQAVVEQSRKLRRRVRLGEIRASNIANKQGIAGQHGARLSGSALR